MDRDSRKDWLHDDRPEGQGGDGHEPMFNAPWPAVVLAVLIILCRVAQMLVGDAWLDMAFTPARLDQGEWPTLATNLLIYPDWGGAILLAALALAFAAPVSRWFGSDRSGAAAVAALFIIGGVAGAVVHTLFYMGQDVPFSGGYGAIAALAGAASRLMRQEPGRMGPPWGMMTLGLLGAFIAAGLLQAAAAPFLGFSIPPGWQGNIASYVVGALLIGLFKPAPKADGDL